MGRAATTPHAGLAKPAETEPPAIPNTGPMTPDEVARMAEEMARAPVEARAVWGRSGYIGDLQEERYHGYSVARSPGLRTARRDWRGVFSGAFALAVLGATALDWYQWSSAARVTGPTFSIYSHPYRGWYLLVAVAAGLAVLAGALDYVLRPGERGALAAFVALRAFAVATLAVTVCAAVLPAPGGTLAPGPGVSVSLQWPIWVALGCAAVTLAGSLASGLSRKD